jgi:hypothetical protein
MRSSISQSDQKPFLEPARDATRLQRFTSCPDTLCNGHYGHSIKIVETRSFHENAQSHIRRLCLGVSLQCVRGKKKPIKKKQSGRVKRGKMRSIKYLASFAAATLLLGASAFAKDLNSGSFELTEPAHVGSTVLKPGHYKVEWTGPETGLKVSITQRGKTVATADATLKQLPAKSASDAITLGNTQDNTKRLDEIDFSHRSEALVLSGM